MRTRAGAVVQPYRAEVRKHLGAGQAVTERDVRALAKHAASVPERAAHLVARPDGMAVSRPGVAGDPAAVRSERLAALLFACLRVQHRRDDELSEARRSAAAAERRRRAAERSLKRIEARLSSRLAQSDKHLRRMRLMSRAMLLAHEAERRSISRDLHDVVAQLLTGVAIRLAVLGRELGGGDRAGVCRVRRDERLVLGSVRLVHRFARDLRPATLDELGLLAALRSHAMEIAERTGLRFIFVVGPDVEGLGPTMRTVLYRVICEAVSNVVRHAKASCVRISIARRGEETRFSVRDDGRSFRVGNPVRLGGRRRLGLVGMRERVELLGGTLSVQSHADRGTKVSGRLPRPCKESR